ncbi:Antagonist of mitotic exit network protein 1 [Bienertia sinuspersici]
MEAERRSKRKPLSDCTNIIVNQRKKPLPSSSSSKNPNPKTLIKPPKPSNVRATPISSRVIAPTSSSQKSHTSTGSNNSSNSVTVPSIPQSPEPPAPPTPTSDAVAADSKKSRLVVNQSQRDDETRRKDKGKMVVDTPIIPLSPYMTSKPLRIASSSAPGRSSGSGIQAVQSDTLHEQTKDKGKTTINESVIQLPAPFISRHLELSSPGISGCSVSETSVVHSQTPNIEESEPSTPHAPLTSPATSGKSSLTQSLPPGLLLLLSLRQRTRDRPVTIYGQRRGRQGRKHAVGNFSSSFSEQNTRKTGYLLQFILLYTHGPLFTPTFPNYMLSAL